MRLHVSQHVFGDNSRGGEGDRDDQLLSLAMAAQGLKVSLYSLGIGPIARHLTRISILDQSGSRISMIDQLPRPGGLKCK